MEHGVIIAGFGGQGVILAGKILAQAGMDHGLQVTWLPSYGPEMRGGTANCTVVLSEDPVGSPIIDEPTGLVAMNLPSLDKFEAMVAPRGTIIVNSSLIEREIDRDDVSSVRIPLNEMAEEIGNPRTINMIALGALVKATGIVPLDTVTAAMRRMLEDGGKDRFIEPNERALRAGADAA